MIYDRIERAGAYLGIHPRLDLGLRFLLETDFDALEDGRVALQGDDVFAILSTGLTREENPTPETHEKYMDIQYLISGRELVGVAPVEEMTELMEASPELDIWFHHGPTEQLTLGEGRFMVLWPGDAHAPSIAWEKPSLVRKCVVKVRV